MKETVIQAVLDGMRAVLTDNQLELLTDVTRRALSECEITPKLAEEEQRNKETLNFLGLLYPQRKWRVVQTRQSTIISLPLRS